MNTKYLINQLGSVQDVHCAIINSSLARPVEGFKEALRDERENKNRASVIKMLERAIRKRERKEQA